MTHDRAHRSTEVLDPATLDRLARLGGAGDPDLLIELIDLFVDDATARVRSMSAALASGDIEEVERVAHTLKSASANIGAITFSTLCGEIESAAHDDEPVEDMVTACVARFEGVLLALADCRRAERDGSC